MSILVIGSFMMDLVVRTSRAPENGETIIGERFGQFPGGKGANQAVAAARLGATVSMAGKLGKDDFGREFLTVLEQERVGSDYVRTDASCSTGIGSIVIDQTGQNRIIVVPGANMNFTVEEVDQLEEVIRASQTLILQLEMRMEVVERAAELAAKHGVPVILNPAPAQALSDSLLKHVTYLTPNETELELLTGVKANGAEEIWGAAKLLITRGVQHVIVTIGEKGAVICHANGFHHVPGFPVSALDTVAAGDSFNGALAVELLRGASLPEAVHFANAVGALAVTKEGAIPSLPKRAEVDLFMLQQEAAAHH